MKKEQEKGFIQGVVYACGFLAADHREELMAVDLWNQTGFLRAIPDLPKGTALNTEPRSDNTCDCGENITGVIKEDVKVASEYDVAKFRCDKCGARYAPYPRKNKPAPEGR